MTGRNNKKMRDLLIPKPAKFSGGWIKKQEIHLVFYQEEKPNTNQTCYNEDNTGFFVLHDRFALPDMIKKANFKTFFDRN